MVSGNSTHHGPHCGFLPAVVRSRTPARPLAMAQTTVTSMASGSSMNHGGLSRRLNPEDEPFFILGFLLLGATIIVHLDNTFQGRTCTISRLSHDTAGPAWQGQVASSTKAAVLYPALLPWLSFCFSPLSNALLCHLSFQFCESAFKNHLPTRPAFFF